MPARRETGTWGEALAARHLQTQGYLILARNWRAGHGELDIVAQLGDAYVFVEVRARHGDAHGAPEETLGPRKRRTLIATAQAFLQQAGAGADDASWRIDVIAIDLDERNAVRRISHIENAITAED